MRNNKTHPVLFCSVWRRKISATFLLMFKKTLKAKLITGYKKHTLYYPIVMSGRVGVKRKKFCYFSTSSNFSCMFVYHTNQNDADSSDLGSHTVRQPFANWGTRICIVLYNIFDPHPSTNQSTSLKSGSSFLVMVSVGLYVRNAYVRTKQNKPIERLNHFSS